MGTTDELNAFSPATQILRALSKRKISAAELLEGYLRRVARYDADLNSIVIRDFDRARRDARAADERRSAGDDGPLLGLPITVKESVDVEGLASTAGVTERIGHQAKGDALTVTRLRQAGAIVMGKTNVCTWLADFNADNPVYGRTNNPWNLDLTPGGSSGGSATLAAGLTGLDLGSDLGGSLRIPAAFCGLWGHKPSAGIVPNTGHFPGSDRPNPAFPMAAQGLHARSVSDLVVGLNVIMGPDADLETGWQLRLPAARHLRLKDFRVAVLPAMQWLPVDGEIVSALNILCDWLRNAGALVREVSPAGMGDLRDHYRIFRAMMGFTVSAHWPDAVRERMVAAKLARQEEFHAADAQGFGATAPQLAGWLGKRALYRSAWQEFFRGWDILLTPMSLVPAFEHTRVPTADRRLQINGNAVEFDYMSFYPSVATLAGLPAVAFPAGKNKAGLPLGLQAIGPLLEDFTVLKFAALIEDEFGSFKPPDGYDGDLT